MTDFKDLLGHIRHVLGVGQGRLSVRPHVRAQKCEVGRMARPHPIVDLAAVFADRGGRCKDDPQVLELQRLMQLVARAIEEALHVAASTGCLSLTGFSDGQRCLFDSQLAAGVVLALGRGAPHLRGHILDAQQHPERIAALRRDLIIPGRGDEALLEVVVIDRAGRL